MFKNIKEKFRQIFSNDDTHEFKPLLVEIEESPVSPLGRTMFWIIVSVFLFAVLWTIWGKVDVVISARGGVIPDGEIKILQPLDVGVIDNILVKEGDYVKKGQVVMEINPSSIEPQLESSQRNLGQVQLEMSRLKAISGIGRFRSSAGGSDLSKTQSNLYSSSVGSLTSQLQAKQMALKAFDDQINAALATKSNYTTLLKVALDRKKRLDPVVDIIPKEQYDKVITDISTYESNIQEATFKLEELRHQKSQTLEEMAYIRDNFKAQNLEQLSERQKQEAELVSQYKQASFRSKKQQIVSPVDGYVNVLFIHTVGGVVTPAEKLMSIVPVDTPLLVKANVLSKDIGFIRQGMEASIKVDTYEFQKYGILKGKVKTISSSSVDDQKLGPIYPVYITPLDKSLKVEGRWANISPGMSLTAEMKVRKRRVIEFFIYPLIKYWGEGISVR